MTRKTKTRQERAASGPWWVYPLGIGLTVGVTLLVLTIQSTAGALGGKI